MWWMLVLAGGAGGVLLGLFGLTLSTPLLYRRALRKHRQALAQMAEQLRLEQLETTDPFGALLSGAVGEFELSIEAQSDPAQFRLRLAGGFPRSQGVACVIDAKGRISDRLTLTRSTASLMARPPRDLSIGDPAFDREVAVYGHEFIALATLDPVTRGLAGRLIRERGITVEGGRLSYFLGGGFSASPDQVQLVEELLNLAERLSLDEAEIPTRLALNLHIETVDEVRRRLARALFGGFPGHELALRLQPQYVEDPDPIVRFYAKSCDSEEGLRHLREALEDPRVDLELRYFAARRLGSSALERLLPDLEEAVDLLIQALEQLAKQGRPGSEQAIAQVLHSPHDRARIAAALALAPLGTLAVVPALLAIKDGLLQSAEVKGAAKDAIAAIQGRHGHPAEGALSVANAEDRGALSEAPGSGAVSLSSDPV